MLGVRMRAPDRPAAEPRRRRPRPPSRSRKRAGGATSAVLLMVLGTGTLGAFPAVQAKGRVVDTAATSGTPDAPLFGLPVTGPELALPGDTVTVLPAAGAIRLPAGTPQGSLEQRPAQFT